jgi:uncharacterized membrane protein
MRGCLACAAEEVFRRVAVNSNKDVNGEVQVGMYTFFEKVFKRTLLFYLICALLSIILGIIKLLGVFPYG